MSRIDHYILKNYNFDAYLQEDSPLLEEIMLLTGIDFYNSEEADEAVEAVDILRSRFRNWLSGPGDVSIIEFEDGMSILDMYGRYCLKLKQDTGLYPEKAADSYRACLMFIQFMLLILFNSPDPEFGSQAYAERIKKLI